jgi:hypothetical protein
MTRTRSVHIKRTNRRFADTGFARLRESHTKLNLCEQIVIITSMADQNIITTQVPEQYRFTRPQNDELWQKIRNGPISINTNTNTVDLDQDIDDVATYFAQQWFAMVQANINCAKVLQKIVEKYEINSQTRSADLPFVISAIYSMGDGIFDIHKLLNKDKPGIFGLEKIRSDWGSITACHDAPDEEVNRWLENAFVSLMNMLQRQQQEGLEDDTTETEM